MASSFFGVIKLAAMVMQVRMFWNNTCNNIRS